MVDVFDFDGVLADSNQIKIDSFVETLPENEQKLRRLMKEMYDPAKVRDEMFAAVLKAQGRSPEAVARLGALYTKQYGQTVQDAIVRRGARPEAKAVLERLLAAGHTLYINSDTPEDALKQCVEALGLASFFKAVLGRPASKEENLEKIAHAEGVGPDRILFFADGESDLRAARHFGCRFIGLRNEFNHWTDHEEFTTVGSIEELVGLLMTDQTQHTTHIFPKAKNLYKFFFRSQRFNRIVKSFLSRFANFLAKMKGFDFPPKFQWDWKLEMLLGKYEKETTKEFKKIIKPGMTVVDIGGHIGYFTILFSKLVGKRGRVLAFEADAENYQLLKKNTTGRKNVNIYNVAVSDKSGEMNFFKTINKTGSHSLFPSDFRPISITVKADTLDHLLEELAVPKVDVIKMDIEGGEPLALQGMAKILEQNPDIVIIMEFSVMNLKVAGYDPLQILQSLSDKGFAVRAIEDNKLLAVTRETIAWVEAKNNSYVNILVSRKV